MKRRARGGREQDQRWTSGGNPAQWSLQRLGAMLPIASSDDDEEMGLERIGHEVNLSLVSVYRKRGNGEWESGSNGGNWKGGSVVV